jgi:hypothetical protein
MSRCQTIGGGAEIVQHLDPIFRALARGVAAVPRTPQALSVVDSPARFDAAWLRLRRSAAQW